MNSESPQRPENSPRRVIDIQPKPPLPAGEGLAWLKSSGQLIRGQLMRLLLLGLLLQFLAGVSQYGILFLLFIVAVPALTAGMLEAFHQSSRGEKPSVLVLFSAFSQPGRLPGLLGIGGLTLGIIILTAGFIIAGSLGTLDPELIARIEAGDQNAVAEIDPAILQRAIMGMGTGFVLSACLSYFTVPLIWFGSAPLGGAILVGLRELFRNWKALLVLGLLMGLVGFPVFLGVGMMLSAQMLAASPSPFLTLLILVLVVLYQLLVFATQYESFRAIFSLGTGEPPVQERDDQLVA